MRRKIFLALAALAFIALPAFWLKSVCQTDEEILDKARQLRDKGSWSQSVVEYQDYLSRNPHNMAAKKEVGMVRGWNMEWKNAQSDLEKYVQNVPTDVEALETLGDVYLYDNQYTKALDTYKKAIAVDPSLEPKLKDRMQEARRGKAPYATYDFYYYREKNRKTEERSTTLEHEWAWYQPVRDNFYLVGSYGFRIDDTIYKRTPIYGAGIRTKIMPRSWLDVKMDFEKDRGINPRYDLSMNFLTVPAEDYELALFQDITWYWDGNTSYQANADLARAFLKDKSLKLHIGGGYYNIKHQSDYFQRIEDDDPDSTDKHLDLFEGYLGVEKMFTLTKNLGLTLGTTGKINTDETKTWIGTALFNYKIKDFANLYFGGSYGLDTDHYEYRTASAYLSVSF